MCRDVLDPIFLPIRKLRATNPFLSAGKYLINDDRHYEAPGNCVLQVLPGGQIIPNKKQIASRKYNRTLRQTPAQPLPNA